MAKKKTTDQETPSSVPSAESADFDVVPDEDPIEVETEPKPDEPITLEENRPETEGDSKTEHATLMEHATEFLGMIDELVTEGFLDAEHPIRASLERFRAAIVAEDDKAIREEGERLFGLVDEHRREQDRDPEPEPEPEPPKSWRVLEDGKIFMGGFVRVIRAGSVISETTHDMKAVNAAVAKGALKLAPI